MANRRSYLKSTNFHGYFILWVEKNYISCVLIFANDFLREGFQVLIFDNLDFFVDGLQPVVVGGLGSSKA